MDPLLVVPLGVQKGYEFGSSDSWPQYLQAYRLNLLQISAEHNLAFVAFRSKIAVGAPSFPEQTLPSTYSLLIDSKPSSDGLRGYIDTSDAHAINHLLLGFLGSEEVLIAARDDGDVDAYLVRHIVHALKRKEEVGTQDAYDLRPFLHINVGISAWGLAIHQEARLIAVSSNNHEIRLVSFALANGSREGSVASSRAEERLIVLPNGNANIPSISFCNTGDDPDARWLLTTDVSGVVTSWDLHSLQKVNRIFFGPQPYIPSSWNAEAAGWAVSFLDTRTFLSYPEPAEELYGSYGKNDRKAGAWDMYRSAWDMGANWRKLKTREDRSLYAMRKLDQGESIHERVPSGSTPPEYSLATEPYTFAFDVLVLRIASDLREMDTEMTEDQPVSESDDPATPEPDTHERHSSASRSIPHLGISASEAAQAMQVLYGPDSDNEDEDMEEEESDFEVPENELYISMFGEQAMCPGLPCPLLYSSVSNIFLLQPAAQHASNAEDHLPITYVADQGEERFPSAYPSMTRGCMYAHIPALGVVIIGNQVGMVSVMSCIKTKYDIDIKRRHPHCIKTRKWVYGLHLEARLPFEKQEDADLRPAGQLYGMAVAPMQGSYHLSPDQQRWRLLIMYLDETVLSYEISRRRSTGGINVTDMMI